MVYAKLKAAGWHVIVIWECELKNSSRDKRLEELFQEITSGIGKDLEL